MYTIPTYNTYFLNILIADVTICDYSCVVRTALCTALPTTECACTSHTSAHTHFMHPCTSSLIKTYFPDLYHSQLQSAIFSCLVTGFSYRTPPGTTFFRMYTLPQRGTFEGWNGSEELVTFQYASSDIVVYCNAHDGWDVTGLESGSVHLC